MTPMRHPLEDVFGMEDDTMDRDYAVADVAVEGVVSDSPPVDHKDEDDVEIEKRIDEVYKAAIDAFNNQTAYTEIIEPRYAARNAEVAAGYLNIALAAANSRSKAKTDRKRANQSFIPHGGQGKTTNNIVIANREEVLRMINVDGHDKAF